MSDLSNLKAAELISRSLSGVLSDEEEVELQQYMEEQNEEQVAMANSYASLAEMIEKSAVWSREQLRAEEELGLSEVSKERMRRSMRKARVDALRQTSTGYPGQTEVDSSRMVAENRDIYQTQDFSQADSVQESSNDLRATAGIEGGDEIRQAVSRFTMLKKIGEGGLGTVWLARDELLHRNVAIKELNETAAKSRRQWERFRREAEITGHLEHPNVVPLYMSGVNPETRRPFYAMRFLGKRTLSEAIEEYHAKLATDVAEPLDLHRLLNSFLKVCQAIAYAHSRGVIHRDLKPENVVLDNFDQVLVLDWGLAKMESEGELAMRLTMQGDVADASLSATLDGDIVGTPLYMAPEQAAGDLEKVDARTDVYGLGAILFAILTGVAPHQNSNVSRDGKLRVKDFLDSIVSSETPSPRNLNSAVSKDLEAICMRAMAKEKYARYGDVTELAAAVERWIAGRNEKESRYDAMRMAGRDLKSRLCVQLRQLSAVAAFMVELPPIQGLVDAMDQDQDEYNVWRERLSQILLALVKTKPNMSGASYIRIEENRARELARIERSLLDVSNVRGVPQSRLVNAVANSFQTAVLEQFPGECIVSFECNAGGTVRVQCGVPVFDQNTEEPFGLVVADAEIGNLVRPELQMSESAGTVYLTDDNGSILFTSSLDSNVKSCSAEDLFSDWSEIKRRLRYEVEFLDSDQEVYATRLPLPGKQQSIHILYKSE